MLARTAGCFNNPILALWHELIALNAAVKNEVAQFLGRRQYRSYPEMGFWEVSIVPGPSTFKLALMRLSSRKPRAIAWSEPFIRLAQPVSPRPEPSARATG